LELARTGLKKVEDFSGKFMPLCYIPAPLNDEIGGRELFFWLKPF
jgi:hypothetical protein